MADPAEDPADTADQVERQLREIRGEAISIRVGDDAGNELWPHWSQEVKR